MLIPECFKQNPPDHCITLNPGDKVLKESFKTLNVQEIKYKLSEDFAISMSSNKIIEFKFSLKKTAEPPSSTCIF